MDHINIWAIVWPVLKNIFNQFELIDVFQIFIVYIIGICVMTFFLKEELMPEKKQGNFFSEILHLVIDIVILISPCVIIYFLLREKYPTLQELFFFIIDKQEIKENILKWSKILLVSFVVFGFSRWIIHKISLLIQRIIVELPLKEILTRIVLVCEGIMMMVTMFMLPFTFLSLFQEAQARSLSLEYPSSHPNQIDETVWSYIQAGVKKAEANGVSCDPYLLSSLKVYETGSNVCTLENEYQSRPNQCASSVGAVGIIQFLPETFERNAQRYGVEGSPWEPEVAFEVACYFIHDEVQLSLDLTENEFVSEFSDSTFGFIWNADSVGASTVYRRALEFRDSAMASLSEGSMEYFALPQEYRSDGYVWPASAESYVTFEWGVPMWYGSVHNGIDIAMPGFSSFPVRAVDSGKARYWSDTGCNAGVIELMTSKGDMFQYVHMELDPGRLEIPTTGDWVSVEKGDYLGWVYNGKTYLSDGSVCSTGPHLHLMRVDGSRISEWEFKR